jgi:hypothetical protein
MRSEDTRYTTESDSGVVECSFRIIREISSQGAGLKINAETVACQAEKHRVKRKSENAHNTHTCDES